MPADDAGRLNQDADLRPVRPQPSQEHPQKPIPAVQAWAVGRPPQHRTLVPEREILELERLASLQSGAQRADRCDEDLEHVRVW